MQSDTFDQRLTRLVSALQQPLSPARLFAYRAGDSDDLDLVANYLWNVALCEALYPGLDALEISLRNSIHASITSQRGTEYWFDDPTILRYRQPQEIDAARGHLIAQSKTETAGRIVAELRFGFWTTLLSGPYEQHLWKPKRYHLLRAAFPHIPIQQRTRIAVHKRYNSMRVLRNRVFHFEPIWNRSDLPNEHRQIIETIGWISPALRDTVEFCDRFPDVFAHGRQDLKDKIQTYLATT